MRSVDLDQLQKRVLKELDEYVYSHHPDSLGVPLQNDYIQKCLDDMRASLISPYWMEVKFSDTREQWEAAKPIYRQVIVVADNKEHYLLAFDPDENEFMLVYEKAGRYGTINIRGDAVGCFISI